MGDPLLTPALVGFAVSSFFTEVISAAKSAYGHKKKCQLLLQSVNKLQPHIDAACPCSALLEKAQSDALAEIKGILKNARRFAERGAAESKSERRKRAMVVWRWGKLPAELLDIVGRIEEAMRNVVFCAALKTLTERQDAVVSYVPQQIQRDRIVGVDEPFSRLKASILKASDDRGAPSHLGLHGRGGAGKTLLAQMLHNDTDIIGAYGSGSVMWITVGLDARVRDVYKSMATSLQDGGAFEKLYGHRGLKDQRTYLWNAFEKRKVFLILDDVWQERCEESHAMMYWLNIATAPGSATLITTRNYEVLSRVHAESEVVLSLSEEDSWTLFCSQAFDSGALPATVSEQVARDVCRECGGLPLALIVVGSAMMEKVEAGEWNSALCYLKRSKAIIGSSVDGELFGRLRLSYDTLESDKLKTCFLYFAAFPEDYKIPTVKLFNMWIAEGLVDGEDEARAHLKVLEKRSLIHLVRWGVYAGEYSRVHDILRDLALQIMDTAEAGECGYDCFFQSGSMVRTFPDEKRLKGMRRVSFFNTRVPKILESVEAPQLQVCLLSGIGEGDLQTCFMNPNMSSLKYLDLSRNWFHSVTWALVFKSVGEWKFLMHLDLSESLLQLPENMGELKFLENLDLFGCASLKELPESMGELKRLVRLNLYNCSSLKELPEKIGELKCLVRLDLAGCTSLKELPESMGELKCLVHLNLAGCTSLKELPESMGELKCLVRLDLAGCTSLKELPESMGKLKCLVHLNLAGCTSLKELPESMGELKCLVRLDLAGCTSLKELPESMGELKCLVRLDLAGCTSLKELPESMGELKCLVHLNLAGCTSLKELPESMGELKCLVHLNLARCTSLKELPESMGELKCLVRLDLAGCTSLKELPESMGELKCLVRLDLAGCTSLKELPESMGELKCLVRLDLAGCTSLKELPESMGELKCLVHLNLAGCTSLKELPESMGELKCLVHLNLAGCTSLKELPESMGELKRLVYLSLSGCTSLKELPESMGELKRLVRLNLRGCTSLKELPESMGELNRLVRLDLVGCISLKELPESMGDLKRLVRLDLYNCSSLKELPEKIGELKCLVRLDLAGCTSLKELPESIGELKRLVQLDLPTWVYIFEGATGEHGRVESSCALGPSWVYIFEGATGEHGRFEASCALGPI